jgi:hypothetical protein
MLRSIKKSVGIKKPSIIKEVKFKTPKSLPKEIIEKFKKRKSNMPVYSGKKGIKSKIEKYY